MFYIKFFFAPMLFDGVGVDIVLARLIFAACVRLF